MVASASVGRRRWGGGGSSSGRRTVGWGMIPSSASAALAIVVPWDVRMMASTKGISERWIAIAATQWATTPACVGLE